MLYLWLKALHLAAVVTWIGGMIMLGLALTHAAAGRPAELQALRPDRVVGLGEHLDAAVE